MKKWMLILLALLLLTGCGAKKTETQEPVEKSPVQETQTPETPEETTKPEAVEIPVTINGEDKSYTEMNLDVAYETRTEDGLVEDTVGYVLEYPVFSGIDGAETINQYYQELMEYLTDYAASTVYSEAAERHTVADVTGSFEIAAADEGLQLGVTYKVAVKFADSDQEESFDRTDVFQPDTGTLLGSNG